MTAGASAWAEQERQRQIAAAHERRADEARRRAANYGRAARTELETSRYLAQLTPMGYHQLADRAWPGSKRANIDLILVGPSGVYVIDTKDWSEVSVHDNTLWCGQHDASDDLDKLQRICDVVEQTVVEVGLAPLEVVPVLAFAGRKGVDQRLGRVHLLGSQDVARFCVRRGSRLDERQVEAVLASLMAAFPPWASRASLTSEPTSAQLPIPVEREPETAPEPTRVPPTFSQPHVDPGLAEAAMQAALSQPIEDWMTFLHPDQAKVVRRAWSGPARIRGSAGTGKTVLGLHRAAYLASTRPGHILYVSFVRTLPLVLESLFERMAPDHVDRVEFTGLHAWATALLRDRGVPYSVDGRKASTAYRYAWHSVGKPSVLSRLDVPWTYWQEEIDYVIKGRGLTSFEAYADLVRVGRRSRLLPEHRRAVWDLYCEYERQLDGLGAHDFNDLLLLALAEVRRLPPEPGYVAVVADEVQDLNLVGVRLLHALVGDAPDGLLLIGDGQQSVYPGGFTLAEAGIAVTGRSTVLRVNYRNTAEILETATAVVAHDRFSDLDVFDEAGERDFEVARRGVQPVRVDAASAVDHDLALVSAIEDATAGLGVRRGDVAVLAATKKSVRTYMERLSAAGIACVNLEKYDGRTQDAVKVGTFKRAKGLEFKHVFLPGLADGPTTRWVDEPESAYRERLELERRELFVGMTRARDGLWLGFVS